MSDPNLDRVSKLGPAVTVILAALTAAGAWGANAYQLSSISKTQEVVSADLRAIREELSGSRVASQFTRETIADLQLRVRDIERGLGRR